MDSVGDRDATSAEPPPDDETSTTERSRPGTHRAEAGRARPRPAPHPAHHPAVESVAGPTIELPVAGGSPAGVAAADAAGSTNAAPRRTRRWVLAGLGGLILGGGAGVGAGVLRTRHRRPRPLPPPPAALDDALSAERRLIAVIDASLPAHPDLRHDLTEVRRNHAAHASALQNALRAYRPSPAAGTNSPSSSRPAARGRAALRAAETAAGRAAARRAAALAGADATLLASIAACEATHAELLA